MRAIFTAVTAVAALALATTAGAQVTFYAGEGFHGPRMSTDHPIPNFERAGFNDRASSVIVERGRWEACEHAGFAGRCVVLGPGQYPSLASLGMDNRISSVRPLAGRPHPHAYAPAPAVAAYDYYPRHGERLYEANVTSVRAVVSQPQQRCWVEREQVARDTNASVPGAILGGVVGGVLGHQIGGGRGQDVATALGAVGGAAVGANVGANAGGRQVVTQDVQRCRTVAGPSHADYWDVTYVFRGREHHVQLAAPPGPTITVNRDGEPRV